MHSFFDRAVELFHRRFPAGFEDPQYFRYERGYKERARDAWRDTLNEREFKELLSKKDYGAVAHRAKAVCRKSRAMLHSTQQAALNDAVKKPANAERFCKGLYDLTYGSGAFEDRFNAFAALLEDLPQPGQKLTAWPIQTIFPFFAHPDQHLCVKPKVTRKFLREVGLEDKYVSYPNWETYSLLEKLATELKVMIEGLKREELKPRDMIDIQSFIWVVEYPDYVKTY